MTARGNCREPIFFEDGDQDIYSGMLAEEMHQRSVQVRAYCRMPNLADEKGLGRAVGETHRRHTNFINARGRSTGHLFQSRIGSVVMDEAHLIAAARYVSLNPVRARLVECAQDRPWSRVRAHLAGEDDALASVRPVLARVERFADLVQSDGDEGAFRDLRAAASPDAQPAANPRPRRRSNWNCCVKRRGE